MNLAAGNKNSAFLNTAPQGNYNNNYTMLEFCIDSGSTDHLINTKEHFV